MEERGIISTTELQSRLDALKAQQIQLIANLNAVAGAIQFAEQLLASAIEPAVTETKE